VKQPSGEVEQECSTSQVLQVLQAQIHVLADDAGVLGDGGTDQIRGEIEHRIVREFGLQTLLRQLHPITHHPWKTDFEGVPLRPHRLDLDGLARWLRWRHDRLGGEIEGDAEYVRILDVEEPVLVQLVGLAAQGAADDLLAQQLGTEGTHARPERG